MTTQGGCTPSRTPTGRSPCSDTSTAPWREGGSATRSRAATWTETTAATAWSGGPATRRRARPVRARAYVYQLTGRGSWRTLDPTMNPSLWKLVQTLREGTRSPANATAERVPGGGADVSQAFAPGGLAALAAAKKGNVRVLWRK